MANNQMMEPSMTQTAREIFIVGLRNAHAMETQARELMERQSERLDEYPTATGEVMSAINEVASDRAQPN
jgi:ferritin-like metal-binding protein YciE